MNATRSHRLDGYLLLVIALLMGFAYYLEYAMGIKPCILCMMQRLMYYAIFIITFISVMHRPRGRFAFHAYHVLVLIIALAGLGFALRQVWLQHHPLVATACLPGLEFAFQHLSFAKAFMLAISGTADCGVVHWTFLSLSIADWSAIVFAVIAGFKLRQLFVACGKP